MSEDLSGQYTLLHGGFANGQKHHKCGDVVSLCHDDAVKMLASGNVKRADVAYEVSPTGNPVDESVADHVDDDPAEVSASEESEVESDDSAQDDAK